jgi:hypothetical protein
MVGAHQDVPRLLAKLPRELQLKVMNFTCLGRLGYDVNAVDSRGCTTVCYLTCYEWDTWNDQSKNSHLIQTLCEAGADVNIPDKAGQHSPYDDNARKRDAPYADNQGVVETWCRDEACFACRSDSGEFASLRGPTGRRRKYRGRAGKP